MGDRLHEECTDFEVTNHKTHLFARHHGTIYECDGQICDWTDGCEIFNFACDDGVIAVGFYKEHVYLKIILL